MLPANLACRHGCTEFVRFKYLYRDAGNYKNYGEVVFANGSGLPLTTIDELIKASLIDGAWFVAKDWGVPELFFTEYPYLPELDHEWHEYDAVEEATRFTLSDIINLSGKRTSFNSIDDLIDF